MATFKAIIFATKNHIKSDGTTNIKIRIYHNRSSQYISTPYYIEPSGIGKDGVVFSYYSDADLLNYELGNLVQKYRGVCLKLGSVRISRMSFI
ncbi:MAG: Arm DNA-binding domain-containing protein, partial [Tannerellaceae bacterium]